MNRDSKGTPKLPPQAPTASTPSDKKPTLSELAKTNNTLLGDHTSLRAEYTDTEPTENDRGSAGPQTRTSGTSSSSAGITKNEPPPAESNGGNTSNQTQDGKRGESPQDRGKEKGKGKGQGNEREGGPTGKGSLADSAKKNSIGDPTSLKSEKSKSEITENDRGSQGSKKTVGSKL